MKLGARVHINLPVEDRVESITLLGKLGFRGLEKPVPGETHLTDGKIVLRLDLDKRLKAGLIYFNASLSAQETALTQEGLNPQQIAGTPASVLELIDPNGVAVYLWKHEPLEMPRAEGQPNYKCGDFYEISIETEVVKESLAFWQKLGFSITQGTPGKDQWFTLSDGLMNVGIYEKGTCTHVFHSPAITFFDDESATRIQALKTEKLDFIEEIKNKEGEVEEAIVETREGHHFFVFHA